ncbi:competence protein ComJ [Paenibacillus sp. D51F]
MNIVAQSKEIVVSYSQVCVYPAGTKEPFPEWTDEEVGQGFAWKNRSISSFEAMDDSRCNVAVAVEEGEPEAAAGSVRSILVPFEVPADGKLSIASILSSTVEADVPPGSCGLVFNAVPGADGDAEEQPWTYIFALYPGYEGKAALLVQDEALEPPSPLLLAGMKNGLSKATMHNAPPD